MWPCLVSLLLRARQHRRISFVYLLAAAFTPSLAERTINTARSRRHHLVGDTRSSRNDARTIHLHSIHVSLGNHSDTRSEYTMSVIIIIIIVQPSFPVVGRRPQHAASTSAYLALSSARWYLSSCRLVRLFTVSPVFL